MNHFKDFEYKILTIKTYISLSTYYYCHFDDSFIDLYIDIHIFLTLPFILNHTIDIIENLTLHNISKNQPHPIVEL